ncbi:MAG: hypothetical protein N838_05400 [Thiohalocapsa sp. PB-PSB1]|jgi:hypothetical protein|nr:MAG: hypothetical protein N838_05380 [Thiohalocapsa sp. PB-PSB1]QQO52889.1 MAG: hypothetical protein N838_05400 [Thiohalocapsa sp. PB-PSB1]
MSGFDSDSDSAENGEARKTGTDHVFHVLQNRGHAEKGGLSPFSPVPVFFPPGKKRRALLGAITSIAARAKLQRRAKRPPQFGVGLAG